MCRGAFVFLRRAAGPRGSRPRRRLGTTLGLKHMQRFAAIVLLAACSTPTADGPSQVIIVEGDGASRGSVSLHEMVGGDWQLVLGPFAAVVGRNGIARPGSKREGDGKTPSGTFGLGTAFGEAAGSPTRLPYRQVTAADVWVDDAESPDYNRWMKRGMTNAQSFEVMQRSDGQYALGLVVAYNTSPVTPGHGSAIFLHVWAGPDSPTSGCIALDRAALEQLLSRLDPAKSPSIVIRPPTVMP